MDEGLINGVVFLDLKRRLILLTMASYLISYTCMELGVGRMIGLGRIEQIVYSFANLIVSCRDHVH